MDATNSSSVAHNSDVFADEHESDALDDSSYNWDNEASAHTIVKVKKLDGSKEFKSINEEDNIDRRSSFSNSFRTDTQRSLAVDPDAPSGPGDENNSSTSTTDGGSQKSPSRRSVLNYQRLSTPPRGRFQLYQRLSTAPELRPGELPLAGYAVASFFFFLASVGRNPPKSPDYHYNDDFYESLDYYYNDDFYEVGGMNFEDNYFDPSYTADYGCSSMSYASKLLPHQYGYAVSLGVLGVTLGIGMIGWMRRGRSGGSGSGSGSRSIAASASGGNEESHSHMPLMDLEMDSDVEADGGVSVDPFSCGEDAAKTASPPPDSGGKDASSVDSGSHHSNLDSGSGNSNPSTPPAAADNENDGPHSPFSGPEDAATNVKPPPFTPDSGSPDRPPRKPVRTSAALDGGSGEIGLSAVPEEDETDPTAVGNLRTLGAGSGPSMGLALDAAPGGGGLPPQPAPAGGSSTAAAAGTGPGGATAAATAARTTPPATQPTVASAGTTTVATKQPAVPAGRSPLLVRIRAYYRNLRQEDRRLLCIKLVIFLWTIIGWIFFTFGGNEAFAYTGNGKSVLGLIMRAKRSDETNGFRYRWPCRTRDASSMDLFDPF